MTARKGFSDRAADAAMAFLTALLQNDDVKEELRLKAAGMILERTVPKTAAAKPETAPGAAGAPVTVRFEGDLERWSR